MAEIMREHAVEHRRADVRGDGPLPVGRESERSSGDDDEAAAAKDENGEPISNSARNIWVTETALATALDMGFMSEMLSIFSIIVGVALLLTGIGLVILARAVFGRGSPATRPPLRPRDQEQLPRIDRTPPRPTSRSRLTAFANPGRKPPRDELALAAWRDDDADGVGGGEPWRRVHWTLDLQGKLVHRQACLPADVLKLS